MSYNNLTNAIDLVKGYRDPALQAAAALAGGSDQEDIFFAKDSGTIIVGDTEYGKGIYFPGVTDGQSVQIGKLKGGLTPEFFKGKTTQLIWDSILFIDPATLSITASLNLVKSTTESGYAVDDLIYESDNFGTITVTATYPSSVNIQEIKIGNIVHNVVTNNIHEADGNKTYSYTLKFAWSDVVDDDTSLFSTMYKAPGYDLTTYSHYRGESGLDEKAKAWHFCYENDQNTTFSTITASITLDNGDTHSEKFTPTLTIKQASLPSVNLAQNTLSFSVDTTYGIGYDSASSAAAELYRHNLNGAANTYTFYKKTLLSTPSASGNLRYVTNATSIVDDDFSLIALQGQTGAMIKSRDADQGNFRVDDDIKTSSTVKITPKFGDLVVTLDAPTPPTYTVNLQKLTDGSTTGPYLTNSSNTIVLFDGNHDMKDTCSASPSLSSNTTNVYSGWTDSVTVRGYYQVTITATTSVSSISITEDSPISYDVYNNGTHYVSIKLNVGSTSAKNVTGTVTFSDPNGGMTFGFVSSRSSHTLKNEQGGTLEVFNPTVTTTDYKTFTLDVEGEGTDTGKSTSTNIITYVFSITKSK